MNEDDFTTEDTEIAERRKRVNAVTERVIGAAIEVHKALGPGCWSPVTKCACVTNLTHVESASGGSPPSVFIIRAFNLIADSVPISWLRTRCRGAEGDRVLLTHS